MLSRRARRLKPSPTLQLAARAKELAAQGKDIISLSVGEPDWPTFPAAVAAGIKSIQEGHTKYGPAAGLPELRKLIAEQSNSDFGTEDTLANVTVTAGGKFVLFSAFQCLLDPEDEVLIPAPYWVSYPTMVELADAKPIVVPTREENAFRVTASDIENKITSKTKLLILNSPSNPTGEVSTANELKDIAEVLRKHPQIIVISDDIYNKLVFGMKRAPHLLDVAKDLKPRVVIVNGASKTLSMTGWRVGWAIGPKDLITAMTDYQSQSVSCASTFSQHAVLAALKDGQSDLEKSVVELKSRRDSGIKMLREIPNITVVEPGGAFYLWPSIKYYIGKSFRGQKITDSGVFCALFLDSYGVAVVPGKEFGLEGYLRMSYVLNSEKMKEAFSRLKSFCSEL